MNGEFWINLPVKNVKKAKEFFVKLGFIYNPGMSNDDTFVCLLVGEKKVPVMLFVKDEFERTSMNQSTDTKKSTEVILSFDAHSREEVDEMAKKVKAGGGSIYSEPSEIQGWMYGCGFIDLDGHRWHILNRG